MTDKDSENQGYMSALTFMLLGSMYVSMYATDHVNTFTMICSFIPFTAPSICVTNALAGSVPVCGYYPGMYRALCVRMAGHLLLR